MALGVQAVRAGKSRSATRFLIATGFLGMLFLCFKAYEYYDDIRKGLVPGEGIRFQGPDSEVARLFYFIYFAMTGLHALHLTIGLCVIAVIAFQCSKGKYTEKYYNPVELTGLYWHFVDVVWIFLFPLLYLMDRNQ